jgi:predicted ATPase
MDSYLYRVRGDVLAKRDCNAAEAAYHEALRIARDQGALTFGLQAAHALGKLYQSMKRAADAHAVLTAALEGFSPTPEFPEIEEAQTLLGAFAETDEVKNIAASRQRRLQLQTAYGRAVAWSRGYSSEETKAAFARAREIAASINDPDERFATYYGQWIGSLVRGELMLARETAETFRREAENQARTTESAVALHWVGMTCLWQGELTEAETNLEEARRRYDPERDREAKFRFGIDTGAGATHYLAQVKALLGQHGRARELIEEAVARANESGHVPTRAAAHHFKALFETLRDDAEAAQREAEILLQLSQQYGLATFLALGALTAGWVHARRGQLDIGALELRQALTEYAKQGANLFTPFYQGLLAEIEVEGGDAAGALAQIDEALALTIRMGAHWTDSFLHRIRGEILLKCDPANTAPAEEAFRTAAAIAQKQKARSFELQAALRLAKLYQSAGRVEDAHTVLTPALEGFSPTPEFPEIEEAQRLFTALAETDEVKNATASRQRRLQLQTAYANALIHARGHGAPETSAAFAKAQTLAAGLGDAADRFSAYYGQWVGSLNRCEPATMQEAAAAFLRETELRPDSPEAGVACRISGLTRLYFGDYAGAHANIEKALAILDSERDRDLAFRFGQDQVAAAMIYLALVLWPLGDVERARQFADQAASQATKSGNLQTLAYVNYHLCLFEALRGDRERAAPVAKAVLDLARERAMPIWESGGRLFHGWANWLVGDRQMELAEMRRGIECWRELGQAFHRPYLGALLAEAEASAGNLDIAIGELDSCLAEARSTGERWSDAELHRVRGELLIKRDTANTATAEEAFLSAIAIAQRQKAKSFELRAAMSMARLWRDQGKRDEARELLAPVYGWFTEGFDTRDLKEAKALLAELAA